MRINFKPLEYTAEGLFHEADYLFEGDVDSGWQVFRNGRRHLALGSGYRLMKTRMCGICSTDLVRGFLPFPLPQVIGHEVVAEDPGSMEKCVVEINDTPFSRGEEDQDIYCRSGLHTHSPGRMVLGIDRLPGGFGPYILAPKNAVVPTHGLHEYSAVLIEPFAAAFHAITGSPPRRGDEIAVLGPRRLGMLLIAGLKAYKRRSGVDFKIYALARYKNILERCSRLGSDHEIDLADMNEKSITNRFDMVYDTTGTESGFELALKLAKREVHLKSTSGRKVCGLDHLTPFVVDELSILPFSAENLDFMWRDEKRENSKIYVAAGVGEIEIPDRDVIRIPAPEAFKRLESSEFANRLPCFDLAVASSVEEIDRIIRPCRSKEISLVRPRGAILFSGEAGGNPLLHFISKGGRLRSSRCGDFRTALKTLKENPDIAEIISHDLISHVFPSREIQNAFQCAATKEALKVVVRHF